MTREEQTASAYQDYLNDEGIFQLNLWSAFKAGADWADEYPNLESLWHDTSEEPEGDYCDILHQDENGCCWMESKADVMRLYDTWNEFIEVETIIRWAYVSDLLPKGGKK